MRSSCGVMSADFGVVAVRGYVTFTKAREAFEKSSFLAAFRSLVDCSGATVTIRAGNCLQSCSVC